MTGEWDIRSSVREGFVYIVTAGIDYEDTYILGVYDTMEKAERAIEKEKQNNEYDWYDYARYTIK